MIFHYYKVIKMPTLAERALGQFFVHFIFLSILLRWIDLLVSLRLFSRLGLESRAVLCLAFVFPLRIGLELLYSQNSQEFYNPPYDAFYLPIAVLFRYSFGI